MSNTWLELDLGVLRSNLLLLREAVCAGTRIMMVVKADAYGHGLRPVAETAWACGVRWFVVVHLDEALAVRALLPEAEVVVVGALDPRDAPEAIRHRVVAVVTSLEHGRALSFAAAGHGALRCHAKVDTGMGRLGIAWSEGAAAAAELARLPGLKLEGMCSHFASADAPEPVFAQTQWDRFVSVLAACDARGVNPGLRHMANSGAILCNPEWDLDGVRAGILLYGYGRCECAHPDRALATRPFLQWRTRIIHLKRVPADFPVSYGSSYVTVGPTWLATLDIGYADGYSRRLSNRGWVLVNGRRRRVAGRVTMNLIVVDLGPLRDANVGDTVTLMGVDGEDAIWADEIADWSGTIPYEVLTSIRASDRRYISPAEA